MEFNGIFMGINGFFMGFNAILMGLNRILMEFNGILMEFKGIYPLDPFGNSTIAMETSPFWIGTATN